MGAADGFEELVGVEVQLDVDLVAGGAELVQAAFGDAFGDENPTHAPSLRADGTRGARAGQIPCCP